VNNIFERFNLLMLFALLNSFELGHQHLYELRAMRSEH